MRNLLLISLVLLSASTFAMQQKLEEPFCQELRKYVKVSDDEFKGYFDGVTSWLETEPSNFNVDEACTRSPIDSKEESVSVRGYIEDLIRLCEDAGVRSLPWDAPWDKQLVRVKAIHTLINKCFGSPVETNESTGVLSQIEEQGLEGVVDDSSHQFVEEEGLSQDDGQDISSSSAEQMNDAPHETAFTIQNVDDNTEESEGVLPGIVIGSSDEPVDDESNQVHESSSDEEEQPLLQNTDTTSRAKGSSASVNDDSDQETLSEEEAHDDETLKVEEDSDQSDDLKSAKKQASLVQRIIWSKTTWWVCGGIAAFLGIWKLLSSK